MPHRWSSKLFSICFNSIIHLQSHCAQFWTFVWSSCGKQRTQKCINTRVMSTIFHLQIRFWAPVQSTCHSPPCTCYCTCLDKRPQSDSIHLAVSWESELVLFVFCFTFPEPRNTHELQITLVQCSDLCTSFHRIYIKSALFMYESHHGLTLNYFCDIRELLN